MQTAEITVKTQRGKYIIPVELPDIDFEAMDSRNDALNAIENIVGTTIRVGVLGTGKFKKIVGVTPKTRRRQLSVSELKRINGDVLRYIESFPELKQGGRVSKPALVKWLRSRFPKELKHLSTEDVVKIIEYNVDCGNLLSYDAPIRGVSKTPLEQRVVRTWISLPKPESTPRLEEVEF